jgi:hypothetical protein
LKPPLAGHSAGTEWRMYDVGEYSIVLLTFPVY